jgi:hypothetical protein
MCYSHDAQRCLPNCQLTCDLLGGAADIMAGVQTCGCVVAGTGVEALGHPPAAQGAAAQHRSHVSMAMSNSDQARHHHNLQ